MMSKKMMLVALGAVSAVMFALPAMASAAWDIDPAGASFTGTTTGTGTFKVTGEPTFTCEGPDHMTGSYDAGSQTTGTITFDFTGCHTSIFGFTVACTTGASGNTISSGGTFHNVTVGESTQLQMTLVSTTIKCGSSTPFILSGAVTGTVAAPPCNIPSASATIQFSEAGGLFAETEGTGTKAAATETRHWLLTFAQTITKTC